MGHQPTIDCTSTPELSGIPPVPHMPPTPISFTPTRFPAWMGRHYQWIVSAIAVLALLTLLCLGWAAHTIYDRAIQSASHSLGQAAASAASQLKMMLLERSRDIQTLSTASITRGLAPEALTEQLQTLQAVHRAYRWIGVADSQGTIIAATDSSSAAPDQSQRRWFQLARALTGVRILAPQAHDESDEPSAITLIAPLRSRDGQFLGAIKAIVAVPSLLSILDVTVQVLTNLAWTADSPIEYLLLNEQGNLIADSTPRHDNPLNAKPFGLSSAIIDDRKEQGFFQETPLSRGAPLITAYAHLLIPQADQTLHWTIIIRADRNSALTPVRSFLWTLSWIAMLLLLPLLALTLGMVTALHEEWLTATREFQRASDAEAALTNRTEALQALVMAAHTLSAQHNLNELFDHLLAIARESTGARYAALGISRDEHHEEGQFFSAGTDDAAAQAIRTLPLERGSRETLKQEDSILSLNDLTQHWAALGLFQDHAPMSSFLGVSIHCHGQLFGRLSLANKLTDHGLAPGFNELDEQIVLTLAAQAGTAIQNLQLLEDSKEEARHDSLTKLLNHLAILNALNKELSRAERTRHPVAVLMADLDHFKRINDTYGHPIGDIVLRETARRLRQVARRYDHVGRAGGEEFLIIVPNCDLDTLAECAERFRSAISDWPFDTPNGPLTVTVSIGATVASAEHPLSAELLLKMADYGLYRVKSRGRNGIDIVPHPHTQLAGQARKTA
ncbi:MAG: diguanylate cyclase [Nitrospirae bacterium]|nr:diguanylate cyclase [Nitrospirota bacterium]